MTHAELVARKASPARVPCNGCTACCERDVVPLQPGERDRYLWEPSPQGPVLQRKADGSCIYLDGGCTIHHRLPDICKRFDCRVLVQITPPQTQAIRIHQNPTMQRVYAAGRERALTLI